MMVRRGARLWLAALSIAAASVPASAQPSATAAPAAPVKAARPPVIPTSAFTQQSGLDSLDLSPDGNHIALKATSKDGTVHLAVLDAGTRKAEHNLVIP